MRKILSVFYIFLIVAMLGCSKDPVNAPAPVEAATKFPEPAWKADETGKYPATMTAVVNLPATLAGDALESDKLAAFVNDECRGVGVVVKVNALNVFFVLIQGLSEESGNVTFRYYSNKASYMYEAKPALTFLADGVFGTAENPKTLELTQLK